MAFARVLHHELPVGVFHEHCSVRHLASAQLMWLEQWLKCGTDRGEIGRIIAEAHIDQSGDEFDMYRSQTEGGRHEFLSHQRRSQELALQIVRPLVIWTNQASEVASLFLADLSPTVSAGIEESADPRLIVAQDYDG